MGTEAQHAAAGIDGDGCLLQMRGISKSFAGVVAVDGVDLQVRAGECLGLCGENGAGKSTLMKVLSGVYPHGSYGGEILIDGVPLHAHSVADSERAGIAIIHQELMLVPELSVTENIFLGREIRRFGGRMDYPAMHQRAEALLRELGIDGIKVGQPVLHYGSGHQQLIEIAKALSKQARLIIFDEPSSSLTASETRTLLAIVADLKRRGVACVYISHKLDEVAEVCDRVTVIRDGRHIGTQPMAELDTNRIVTMMVGRPLGQMFERKPHVVGEVVLEASHVTCLDVVNPQRKRVDDVSLQVRRGEILGIAGLIGAGRTELVSAIYGAYPGTWQGELRIDGKPVRVRSPQAAVRAGLCMVPEDRKHHGIVPLMGVGPNITLSVLGHYARAGVIDGNREAHAFHHEMRRLNVRASSPMLPIASLSGGNQQKAVLTRMLLPEPKVLILDEPTRGVDVGAKQEIYRLIFDLAARGIAIIVVSSEMPEVLGLSDRVLVMADGRVCGDFINDGLRQEDLLAAALALPHRIENT
jgi:D-xylose transport system ATP-binding protein